MDEKRNAVGYFIVVGAFRVRSLGAVRIYHAESRA